MEKGAGILHMLEPRGEKKASSEGQGRCHAEQISPDEVSNEH